MGTVIGIGDRHVHSKKSTSKETTINGTLIHDDTILLIVSRVTHDRNDTVTTSRKLLVRHVLHRATSNERFLRIVQDMCHRIHANRKVLTENTQRLFSHRTGNMNIWAERFDSVKAE